MMPDPSEDQQRPNWDELLATLQQMYDQLGDMTGRLDKIHADRMQCRSGCYSCCLDDITVFEVEAQNIRRHHADLLRSGRPHAPGACAFLDEHGACRIYEHRPYVCRTQGYPLRWIEETDEHGTVEMRDICPLNDAGEPVESLPAEDCWTIGPFEDFLRQLQEAGDGGEARRVRLRDLFARKMSDHA